MVYPAMIPVLYKGSIAKFFQSRRFITVENSMRQAEQI